MNGHCVFWAAAVLSGFGVALIVKSVIAVYTEQGMGFAFLAVGLVFAILGYPTVWFIKEMRK